MIFADDLFAHDLFALFALFADDLLAHDLLAHDHGVQHVDAGSDEDPKDGREEEAAEDLADGMDVKEAGGRGVGRHSVGDVFVSRL